VLQCVAVCCSYETFVVTVCRSVLQRVAACCSVLQRVAVSCSPFEWTATQILLLGCLREIDSDLKLSDNYFDFSLKYLFFFFRPVTSPLAFFSNTASVILQTHDTRPCVAKQTSRVYM